MGTPWVSFNGKNCFGCKHLNDRGYCEFTACIIPCTVSATIPEVKPKTNGDRIRSMSDKELAEWFQTVCTASSECSCSDCKFYALECTFEEWLEQEVGE